MHLFAGGFLLANILRFPIYPLRNRFLFLIGGCTFCKKMFAMFTIAYKLLIYIYLKKNIFFICLLK